MAVVRCPVHKIPYNDENPRGCPACAHEREGGDQAQLMRELARMSVELKQPPEALDTPAVRRPSLQAAPPGVSGAGRLPVTEQPRLPVAIEGGLRVLLRRLAERRVLASALAATFLLSIALVLNAGPDFVAGMDPPILAPDEVRALDVDAGASITTVFAILGTQVPRAVQDAPRLARYPYGTGLAVDALNRAVYAITSDVPSWSWRGLRVGVEERAVRGSLALLGMPEELPAGAQPAPRMVAGYKTYASLEQRPHRSLRVAVRPPNGCYDVIIELRPRALGVLVQGRARFAVIGRGDAPLDWVSSRIRVINRSVVGPYVAGQAACS